MSARELKNAAKLEVSSFSSGFHATRVLQSVSSSNSNFSIDKWTNKKKIEINAK
jgi:hypothetical protein